MKKKIIWVTADYFLQVDLPIIYELAKTLDIKWVIYTTKGSNAEKTATEYAKKYDICFYIFYNKWHRYSPVSIINQLRFLLFLKSFKGDVLYLNIIGFPYLAPLVGYYFSLNKVIWSMHHGKIHEGMQLKILYKYYLKYLCRHFKNFQYFSKTQASYFYSSKCGKKIEVIPLAFNYFGVSSVSPSKEFVNFVLFGNIINTKNVGLLIVAACKLRERIGAVFKVSIVGFCRHWADLYQPLIKYPDIFNLEIRSIPNEDIPDLMGKAHYMVLPYKAVTQSGPLRIAYGYNIPVITSDLDGFKESVIENVTGLFFKSEDVDDLVSVMERVTLNHPSMYLTLKKRQKKYLDENFSLDIIWNRYIKMFDQL